MSVSSIETFVYLLFRSRITGSQNGTLGAEGHSNGPISGSLGL